MRAVVGRHTTPCADGHVDDHVGGQTERFGGIGEVARVLRVVHGLDELGIRLPQRHRAADLVRRHVARRHQEGQHTAGKQRLGLADLGGADADRSAGQLQLRDLGTFVRLRVRAAGHARAAQARAERSDVPLHLVEIDTERWCVQFPLRCADDGSVGGLRPHFFGRVAADRFRDPHGERARADRLQKPAPRDRCRGHVVGHSFSPRIFASFAAVVTTHFARLKPRAPPDASRSAPISAKIRAL